MSDYFFDTSALLKRYVPETGSAWVNALTDPSSGNTVHIVQITEVEIVSAFTRRAKGGGLSTTDATAAIAQFRLDEAAEYEIVAVTSTLISSAATLAEGYALRGYDAVQLAAVLEVHNVLMALGVGPLTLVSADTELNVAATAEGLMVEDPNGHP